MVAHFGMSERLGPVYYDHDAEHPFLGMRVATEGGTSPTTTTAIEEEARRLLHVALDEAGEILAWHRPVLDRLSGALLERESLDREELAALLDTNAPTRVGVGLAAASSGADTTAFSTSAAQPSSSSNG
jgi:cell division protease FtsH